MTWFVRLLPRAGSHDPGPANASLARSPFVSHPLEAECRQLRAQVQTLLAESAEVARERQRIKDAAADLEQSSRAIAGLRERLVKECEKDLARVALAVAGRIVRDEIDRRPETLTGMVRAAIADHAEGPTEVRCHPSRAALLARALDGLSLPVAIVADATLAPHDFELRTERGHVDGRIGGQMARACELLGSMPVLDAEAVS